MSPLLAPHRPRRPHPAHRGERRRARPHQGAHARPPPAAARRARPARRRRARRPGRSVGHRPVVQEVTTGDGSLTRIDQLVAPARGRSSSRRCSPGWPAGRRSASAKTLRAAARALHRQARCACRCRRSSGPARATSSPARPTTSRRWRTSSGSASRRSSWRRSTVVATAVAALPHVAAGARSRSSRRRWCWCRRPAGTSSAPARLPVGAGLLRAAQRCRRRDGRGRATIDALGLGAGARAARFHAARSPSATTPRRTRCGLRLRWFPWWRSPSSCRSRHPGAGAGWLAFNGHITIGAATAVALYVQRWPTRSTSCSSWLDEIQFAATSLARIIGVAEVPPDRDGDRRDPTATQIDVDDVRYAYRRGSRRAARRLARPGAR